MIKRRSKQIGQGDQRVVEWLEGRDREDRGLGLSRQPQPCPCTQTAALKTATLATNHTFLGDFGDKLKGYKLTSLVKISNYQKSQFLLVCPHKKIQRAISWKRKELHSPWSSSLNIMGQGVLMLAIAMPHIPSWHMAQGTNFKSHYEMPQFWHQQAKGIQ